MKTKFKDYEVLVPNLDGTEVAERVNVKIPLEWNEELEVWVLTPEAHRIIEDTKARHMGLLLPAEFKELRERFKLSQKEMGELFQAGEKSWTRWETGKQRPSRMVSLLVRALYEGEISINYLLKKAGKPPREEVEWFSLLGSKTSVELDLLAGAFQRLSLSQNCPNFAMLLENADVEGTSWTDLVREQPQTLKGLRFSSCQSTNRIAYLMEPKQGARRYRFLNPEATEG
jgi:DNA-binding transcriptional regulator YiaG